MSITADPTAQDRPAPTTRDASTDVTDRLVLPPTGIVAVIKRHPAASIGVALLAGFVVGRVASRS